MPFQQLKTTVASGAKKAVVAAISGAMLVSACATDGLDRPLTAEEKIGGCIAMIAVGAVLGAVIGNNTGSGDAGDGAMVGAVLGGGACAVWLAFQNEADQKRIAEMRNAAAQSGQEQQAQWVNARGQQVAFRVATSDTSTVRIQPAGEGAAPAERLCRTNNETATAGGMSESTSYLVCRNDDGSWSPQVAAKAPRT